MSDHNENTVMTSLPPPNDDSYTVVIPPWFELVAKFAAVITGIAILWITIPSKDELPLWAQALTIIIVASLFFVAFHPNSWKRLKASPLLQADDLGVYFPNLQPGFLGDKIPTRWLFVPWSNVSNIRAGRIPREDDYIDCAVFDVIATSEEIDEFFIKLLRRRDDRDIVGGRVSVGFYKFILPRPRNVAKELEWMLHRHNNRLQSDAATPHA